MARELVMAPTHWSVGQAIDNLRKSKTLPQQFYEIIVIEPKTKPIGKIAMTTMLHDKRTTKKEE